MKSETWMVIVNPKAGSGRGLKDWPVISNQMYNNGVRFTRSEERRVGKEC